MRDRVTSIMPYVPARYVYLGFTILCLIIIGQGLHIEIKPEGWLVEYKGGNIGAIIAALGALAGTVLGVINKHD